MKTKVKRLSKKTLAVFLGILMLLTSLGIGSMITVGATGSTMYVCISDKTMADLGATKVYTNVKQNESSSQNNWYSAQMTSTNKFYSGKRIYSIDGVENTTWGGLGCLQILLKDDSNNQKAYKEIKANNGSWWASSNYAGKLYNYDGSAFVGAYSDASYANGFSTGDYYIYNNVNGAWYGNDVSAPKMTKSSNTYYYDFYLKKNEVDTSNYVIFKFWDSSDQLQIGPDWESDHKCTLSTSDTWSSTVQSITNYGDKDTAWQVSTSGWTANKYYKLRITLDPCTLSNSRNGRVKFTSTQLANLDPTFSTTSFNVGTSYNLTSLVGVTSGSNAGTVSYSTYQYYDGSWHTISSPSTWTPSSASITKLRVTATDGGVITTAGNTKNAITARSETKETSVTVTATQRTITYSGSNCTFGGTKPTTAIAGDTISFTVTPSSGYRIGSVKYNDGSDHTITASNGTYSFTMPDKNVTVTATMIRQYTVTLSAGTGFATKKYQINGGTLTNYSSALTVDSGATVVFSVTYTDGYEYDSSNSTLNGATAGSSNTTFTISSVAATTTVTLAAKKTGYTGLTAVGKYSTDGTNYTNNMSTSPTIASTTATKIDGTTVTAPDVSGYQFVTWYTANGTFGNALDKQTTFKPNANGAQAVARYKKIFTITASVDNTGKGAGTVTTSKSTVEAGGSYTITTAAKKNSSITSVTVNGTNKGTGTSITISSVTANQTVVAKFASKPHLIGSLAASGWTTPGDEMTSNSDGTKFTITLSEKAAGTYEFKHYNNGTYDATQITSANQTLNGIATIDNTGTNGNYKLVTSVKSNIVLESDGTKFTKITVTPANVPTYNVTLKKVAGSTITSTYMGVEYTTASADAVVPVYSGTEISFTVTAASGKYLSGLTTSAGSLSPAFAVGDSYTGKISNVTSARTVTPTVGNKVTITAKSNKSSLGTVSISPTSARPGENVTITIEEKNGTYKSGSLSVKKADGTAISTTTPSRSIYTSTFTMPNDTASVTVNASFTAYSGESSWVYNGRDTSGNILSAYNSKAMTEGMVSGQKFSYYEVTGRTSSDQLFTVKDTSTATYGYVYFTCPGSWNNLHVYFFDGVSWNWPGDTMSAYDSNGNYRYQIPSGAKKVIFNNGDNSFQTVDIDLTTTNGAYYVSANEQSSSASVGQWDSPPSDAGISSGTEYFWGDSVYATGSDSSAPYSFGTDGFNDHSQTWAKPKGTGYTSGSYFVCVLYPNTTYTINGVTKTTGSKPDVIWMKENPAGDVDAVKVYAKDGAIRSESNGSTYANIADTQIVASASSTTSIGTSQNGSISGQTYETYSATPGETIYIRTTINTTAGTGADTTTNRNKYYVRGFCINGEVSELKTWDSSGVYTTSYKIPEDYEGKIEITPIYYLKDTTNHPIVTFRVTNFPKGKYNWGDTIYAYPFYGKLGGQNNAFGAYPGQPLVFYKGQYQIQIPQKSTAWDPYYSDSNLSGSTNAQKATNLADTAVSGVTMSNGYYDSVHRSVMGYGGNGASSDHVQTYDYGDFYKIFNEKKPVDNIVFDFKYETKKHNFENQPAASTTKTTLESNYGETNGNGFELLTNFHGRHVDLFGTALSGDAADPSKTTPVYVVSIGGVNGSKGVENIAGYYATEWMVYGSSNGTNYSRITGGDKQSIPPEVLVLNDYANSFNNTTYPSAVSGKNLTDWQTLYHNLEAYRGKPVYISYEAADAQIGSGNYATSGGGGATRNDGRWLYSKNGETITSKIRVDVSNDSGATYTPNSELGTPVDDLEAYFTNDGVEGQQTYTTTIDPDKTFDFEANSNNADYKFMGWYMEDGTKITTDNISHTERSGSYTFVARFMYFTGGQLILSHKNITGTAGDSVTYNGSGNTTIAVTVKNGDEVVREISATSSDITLDDKIINNANSAYTIEVTLGASGVGEDAYARTECDKANSFFGNQSAYTSMPQTFSFTVGSLFASNTQTTKKITYNSYFNQVAYSYDVTFKFNGRLVDSSGNRVSNTFRKQGTLTAKQIANYVTGTGNVKYISPNFLTSIAPYEENYGENLVWDFSGVIDSRRQFAYTSATNSYKLTVGVSGAYQATQSGSSKELTVTFDLPFAYDSNGRANNIESMTKDTSQDNFVVTVNYGQIAKKDPTLGHSSPGATSNDNTYVTAPKVLVENGDNTYFQYWDVRDRNNKPVTKCYMTRFNFVAYDNYTVTPVYGSAAYEADDDDSISTSISFLDTTRNQWNNNGNGGASGIINEDALKASDLLFNDFLVSFSYKGKELNSSNLAGVNTGFVVQRLGTLEKYGGDDSRNTDTEYYKEKYKDQDDTASIESCINGSTVNGFDNITVAANQLDNKDRVQWYYSVYNSRGWNDETDKPKNKYTYLRYVYRAYSYIKDSNGITLSEPVYFTMYDKAVQ